MQAVHEKQRGAGMVIKVCGNCCSFMPDPHSKCVGACSATVVLTPYNRMAYPLANEKDKACEYFKKREKKNER